MKIYCHRNHVSGYNSYIVINTITNEAIIIDPGKITPKMIEHIENENYTLVAVLVTHSHASLTEGLLALQKIYQPTVYGAYSELMHSDANILRRDGILKIASLNISYFSITGHTPDSMAYKIGNSIFTGDALLSGTIGPTTNPYAKKLLVTNIQTKLFIHDDATVVFPGHGPITTIGAEKKFNMELGCPTLHSPIKIPKSYSID